MTSPSPQESAPATAGQTGSAQHDEAARQGELTEQAERTGVVVVGAGPAGLTVANLLRAAGVDCVLLEAESREFIERRPRAGFIEEWAVRALERLDYIVVEPPKLGGTGEITRITRTGQHHL